MFTRLLLMGLLCLAVPAQSATLFSTNSTWRFLRGTNEASLPDITAWRNAGFNDASFVDAPAPFWYGDVRPGGTQLLDMQNNYTCIFLRKTFVVNNASQIGGLRLTYYIDDGFVAWINGQPVFSENVTDPAPTTNTLAANQPIDPAPFTSMVNGSIAGLLQEGVNTIAIQVFNTSSSSTDLGFDCVLESIISETVPPVITSVSPAPGSSLEALTQVTVTFSEPVVGVSADDLVVSGIAATGVSGSGTNFTFTFSQPPYGGLQVSLAANSGITDLAVPPNSFDASAPSASWQYTLLDVVPPEMARVFPSPGVTVSALGQIEITFSEDVAGVDASDLLVNNQPATNVIVQLGAKYIFQFSQPSAGQVSVTFATGHGIADLAVPPNPFVASPWSYQLDPNVSAGGLIITEILAANATGLRDASATPEDPDPLPWIELYNNGTTPVDLGGWSLSDDPNEPGQWVFPARAMQPGQYLIVFASGLDIRNPSGTNRFHTNFKLSRSGEFLGLYTPDSPRVLVSSFTMYPEQRNDISYGYDSQGKLRYFNPPTPGAPNGSSTIVGVVAPVHFSVARGEFNAPFNLALTTPTPGALIRYTTNGSEPTAVSGAPYIDPIRITGTTLLRAAAFRTNFLPSRTVTHSYLFNLPAAFLSLPIISLVTDQRNLTGPNGIYGISNVTQLADGTFTAYPTNGGYYNTVKHGLAWERPTSVELIRPEDNSGFQVDAGIRLQGSDYQRPRIQVNDKMSFRLYFRSDYGSGRLNYPLFPLTSAHDFDQIVLRAGFNENNNPFVRDELVRRLSHDMGGVASHGSLLVLCINGQFMTTTRNAGNSPFYNPCERVHEEFLQSYLGGGGEWDVVGPSFAVSDGPPGVIDGDRGDFQAMVNYVRTQPTTSTAVYQRVARWLDLTNFTDYCLLNAYTAMGDWPQNNWRAGRERGNTNAMWRFIVWDAEWGMGIYDRNASSNIFAAFGPGPNGGGLASTGDSEIAQIYQRLVLNREFRLLWADRIQKHFFNGGALTGANYTNRLNEMRTNLQSFFTMNDTDLLGWAQDRLPIFMTQVNSNGLYGYSNAIYGVYASSNAPSFNQRGGRFAPGFPLSMSAPLGGTIYYTINGDDPRVMFTSVPSPAALVYSSPITLNQSAVVRARALLNGTNWSAVTEASFEIGHAGIPLLITEINYNPVGGGAYEFIELMNVGSTTLDLEGMSFEGITFAFLAGASLAPDTRLVLASALDPTVFAARYPGVAVAGYFAGSLNNAGEKITLRDRAGNVIVSVDYDDENGWAPAADGAGYSLEIIDLNGDPDDSANWQASASSDGSPGAPNSTPPAPVVRLNEILAENGGVVDNSGTFPDYVEIQNTGGSPVNLAEWSLTDDGNARKFVFPTVNIPAGSYLVVWCDTNSMVPGLRAPFGLGRNGDTILLYDTNTNRVDAFTFGLQLTNHSVGRVSGEWVLNTPTPGSDNSAAPVASASSLSINEWQASAPPGQSDWIELHNTSALPVALRGAYLATTSAVHRITSHSFVPPFGFVQLFADEGVGPDHLDFKLPAVGGAIILYDATAAEIGRVNYTNAVEGLTRGRLPDGTATIVNFPGSASPGASNFVNTYTGALLNEVLARNRSAVTNAGNAADYIELFNPNGTAFSLFGMSLSVNSAELGQWLFPVNASVPANGYLVIWCDGSRPASFTAGDYNTGRPLDGESGGAYLFNAQGQMVNSVEYGFQVSDLPIGLSGSQWRLLASATPGAVNSAPAALGTNSMLRLNEWMANPVSGADWFELFNPTNLSIELSGLLLTDDPSLPGQTNFRTAPLSFIGPRDFVKWVADGDAGQGRNHVDFSLDAQGETLRLYNTNGASFVLIDSVVFDAQQLGVSEGRLPDGQANIVGFPGSATPSESNYLPLPGVVINEVLTHTDPPLEDAVELRNTSASPVGIGGWYLSDSQGDFKKYRIPDGTSIAAGGFAVIYQNQFSNGSPASFTFDSAHGDEVWLSAADAAGNLTGYRAGAKFGAAENGVSFGRVATSLGVDNAAMSARTFGQDNPATVEQFRTGTGASNSGARVGAAIISEIHYNPAPVPSGEPDGEFVEIYSTQDAGVSLFRGPNTWRLAGAIEFAFPPGVTLAGGQRALIVGFNPANLNDLAAFRARYGVNPAVPIFGPFLGRLNNAGDDLRLEAPDFPQPPGAPDAGFVPYVLVDRVNYTDDAPWPSGAVDGGGLSLQRQGNASYGNEPLNWRASTPTPGAANGSGIVPVPVITASPQSQSLLEGDASTLAVTASGAVPIGYQWRFNGTPVPNATNAAFALDYVVLDNDGDYDCIVSNPGGAALSAAARLGVIAPAVVLIPPTSLTNRTGSNMVFTVGARGSAPLRYQWRLNGTTLPGETNATIARAGILLADDGEYDVLVSNPVNVTMASARLVVLSNTVIVLPPLSVSVVTGATFTVSVIAGGNPLPFGYQWLGPTPSLSNTVNSRVHFVTFTATNRLVTNQNWRVVVRNLANSTVTANAPFTFSTLMDSDGDGIPDNWETAYNFNPASGADRDLDSDGDGMSNLQEYYAGTDPTDAQSRLTVSLSGAPLSPMVSFPALSNRTYTVQFTDNLGVGAWSVLAEVASRTNNRTESVNDPGRVTNRAYRVITPRQP